MVMTLAALLSFATQTASTLPPRAVYACSKNVPALAPSHVPCAHDADGTVVELLGVSVGRVSADVDDRSGRGGLVLGLEAIDDHLTLELADVEVVERDVVVSAGDRAVVCDDRDALGLGLLGDLDARAVVVDEDLDAAALGELLLRDGRVLGGVTLSVLDVRLEAGLGERGVKGLTVAVLPAVRGCCVGEDHTGALGGGAAAAPSRSRRTSGQCDQACRGEHGDTNHFLVHRRHCLS
jgi:hypothetical protein